MSLTSRIKFMDKTGNTIYVRKEDVKAVVMKSNIVNPDPTQQGLQASMIVMMGINSWVDDMTALNVLKQVFDESGITH